MLGVLDISDAPDSMGYEIKMLEEIKLRGLNKNFRTLQGMQAISHDSIKFLIDNATNEKAITVTVHELVYNALINQNTTYPFNGGTEEGWTKILNDAASKDITFATKTQ